MNISSLKDHIINEPELIELILEKAGFHYISDKFSHGTEYRCAWDEDGNPTSIRIYKDTLSTKYFKTGLQGDLITLVQEKMRMGLGKALRFISNIVNYDESEEIEVNMAFSGIFLELQSIAENGEHVELTTYPEEVLNNYMIKPSKRFLDDGISYRVQEEFQVGYDVMSDRILVPWRGLDDQIIGIMGRLNRDELEQHENKWFPIIKFPKSKTLFGYSNNYQYIQESKMVMLFESEKSVMKCKSQGNHTALALGGSSLSEYQANNINSLFPNTIIIGLDEGLDEEQSVKLGEKLKHESYFENNVYYLYDNKGMYLPKGSKMSPADLPSGELKKMMSSCMKKI